jgi:hypothetical protein
MRPHPHAAMRGRATRVNSQSFSSLRGRAPTGQISTHPAFCAVPESFPSTGAAKVAAKRRNGCIRTSPKRWSAHAVDSRLASGESSGRGPQQDQRQCVLAAVGGAQPGICRDRALPPMTLVASGLTTLRADLPEAMFPACREARRAPLARPHQSAEVLRPGDDAVDRGCD